MDSEENIKLNIVLSINRFQYYFIPSQSEPSGDQLQQAYNLLLNIGSSIKWISDPNSGLKDLNNDSKNIIIVMLPFDTFIFNQLIKIFKVIGPMCILSSLKLFISIPFSTDSNILNLAMRRCSVCISCCPIESKDYLIHLINRMGGKYSSSLLSNSTHLVTNDVHSSKYRMANTNGIITVTNDWITNSWIQSQNDFTFNACDLEFSSQFKCPIFSNCRIVITGFSNNIKQSQELIFLIKSNGGVYSPNMILKDNPTHVVANKSNSEKYKLGIELKLNVVTKDWIYDSISKGYCQPEHNYLWQQEIYFSNRSNITINNLYDSFDNIDYIFNSIKQIDVISPIFNGINIYLCGFTTEQNSKLTYIISQCNGTLYDFLNSEVTHVVSLHTINVRAKLGQYISSSLYVVHFKWIADSWLKQKIQPVHSYSINYKEISQSNDLYADIHSGSKNDVNFCFINANVSSAGLNNYIKDEILYQKSFKIKYHNLLMYDQIINIITFYGGIVYDSNQAHIPNYIITSVSDGNTYDELSIVLTVFWLEMVSLHKKMLNQKDHFLFQPACISTTPNIFDGIHFYIDFGNDKYIEESCLKEFVEFMGGVFVPLTSYINSNDSIYIIVTKMINYNSYFNSRYILILDEWIYSCARTRSLLPIIQFQIHFDEPLLNRNNLSLLTEMNLEDVIKYPLISGNVKLCNKSDLSVQNVEIRKDKILNNVGKNNLCNEEFPQINGNFDKLRISNSDNRKICILSKNNFQFSESSENNNSIDFSSVHKYNKEFKTDDIRHSAEKYPTINRKRNYTNEEFDNLHIEVYSSIFPNPLATSNIALYNNDQSTLPPTIVSKNVLPSKDYFANQGSPSKSTQEVIDEIGCMIESDNSKASLNLETPLNSSLDNDTKFHQYTFRIPKVSRRFGNNICQTNKNFCDNYVKRFKYQNNIKWQQSTQLNPEIRNKDCLVSNKIAINTGIRKNHQRVYNEKHNFSTEKNNTSSDESTAYKTFDTGKNNTSTGKIYESSSSNDTVATKIFDLTTSNTSNSPSLTEKCAKSLEKNSNSKILTHPINQEKQLNSIPVTSISVFLLCCVNEKNILYENIKKLGGTYIDSEHFDPLCTHLITGQIIENEQILCGIVSGIWILRPEYIFHSLQSGKFLNEEEYEWGNPKSESCLDSVQKCPYLWRAMISKFININENFLSNINQKNIFRNWIVYLCSDINYSFYRNILSMGGAKIITMISSKNFPTIALIDKKHDVTSNQRNDLRKLLKKKINLCNANYIVDYILSFNQIEVNNYKFVL